METGPGAQAWVRQLPEQGVKARSSQRIPRVLEDAPQPVPAVWRGLIDELLAEWRFLGERIAVLSDRLEAAANADSTAKRLMSVRAIGPVTATASGWVIIERRCQAWVLRLARYSVATAGLVAANTKNGGRRSSVSSAGRSLRNAASGFGSPRCSRRNPAAISVLT